MADASITRWTRLEPRCRDADMRNTVSARVFDPLWLMARQWQLGEFQGEDTGTPVLARVRARTAMLSRCHLGELKPNTSTQAAAYDPQSMPLETFIERQRVRAANATDARMLRLSVEAGLHFLRMLELQPLSRSYRAAFITRYALQPLDEQTLQALDAAPTRFVQTMVGRAPDARRVEKIFRSGPPGQVVLEPALEIAAADRAEVEQTATRWLAWYETLFCEPAPSTATAWVPDRLEYAATVAGRLSEQPGDEMALTASEFYEGHLDWNHFDLNREVNLGSDSDRRFGSITETTVPAPVSFRGAPAARFWEFEDARIDYGLLSAGPADLAQMLIAEYVSSYGNDWFVLPLTLRVGSLTSVRSLVVSDTFGVRTLLRPIGDRALAKPFWSMLQLAYLRRAGTDAALPGAKTNLFFLPPALGRSLEGAPVEDVLFARDEMANLAWAIERSIESPIEQPMPRADVVSAEVGQEGLGRTGEARYRLASTVPAYWIPLLPVQLAVAPNKVISRLKRGAVLQPDGSEKVHQAQGTILNASAELLLHEEEIPREGVRVTLHYQMARWTDGSTCAWVAHRKQVGRGESSSGLRFDSISTDGVESL
jgi:hypothetical protein